MERVHFHQEQMLPELRELEEKGIFSKSETRAILKQRTAFESALVRRVALKSDFIKYVQYEITLEALRKKRVERINATETKTSLSDYCIVRRQFYILERAVRKFKNDVPLWIHYVELAKSNNARALVGKLCSRALSLHPTSPPLYIIAASHELDTTLSPAGARALLQRGIRINPESAALWTEYVCMELGYCEGLRRRWKVLGIDTESENEDANGRDAILSGAIVRAVISSAAEELPTLELLGSLQTLLQVYPTELRAQLIDHLHSEFSSRSTGSGSAADDFRCGAALLKATVGLPSRPLEHGDRLPRIPPLRPLVAAAFPSQTDSFSASDQTAEFVQRIQNASKNLSDLGRKDIRIAELYARWIAAWVAVLTENNLCLYLVLALTAMSSYLCKNKDNAASPYLSTILRVTLYLNKTTSPDETQYRKLSQKFSKACPDDAGLWIARLDAESGATRPLDDELETYSPSKELPETVVKLWAEARGMAKERAGEEELLVNLWAWGIPHISRDMNSSKRAGLWTDILKQSLFHTSPTLHSTLLLRCLYNEQQPSPGRAMLCRKLITQYRPSVLFYDRAMAQELEILLAARSNRESDKHQEQPPRKKRKNDRDAPPSVGSSDTVDMLCMEVIYTAWRVIPDQTSPAALRYAAMLSRLGEEDRANEVIVAAGGSKGKLRLDWEKIRENALESGKPLDADTAEVDELVHKQPEVALGDVEFA